MPALASPYVRLVRVFKYTVVCALLAVPGAAFAKGKVISVDCAKESLNAALADTSPDLTVEFTGECHEDVLIARNDVTLRGAAAGAVIVGADAPATRGPGLTIDGSRNVNLESFAIHDTYARGLWLKRASTVTLNLMNVSGNARGGMLLLEASFAKVIDSSFDDSVSGHGIEAWEGSGVDFQGAVSASRNAGVGILASGSSTLGISLTRAGAQITVDGNRLGVVLQLGAHAQIGGAGPISLSAHGNRVYGLEVIIGSTYQGKASVDGSQVGVEVESAQFEPSSGFQVTNCTFGVYAWLDSFISLGGATATSNHRGVFLDGATAEIDNSNLTGNSVEDLHLEFGGRGSYNGTKACTVSADASSLQRGALTCPVAAAVAPASRRARTSALQETAPEPIERSVPFTLEP